MSLTISVSEIVEKSSSPLLVKHKSWCRVPLGLVADILNGYAFPSTSFNNVKGVPLLRIRDVGNDKTQSLYDGEYDSLYIVKKEDLVIGMDGDFNCARWRGPDALLNQRVCKVIIDTEYYNPKFLDIALPGYLKAINDNTSSVTVKHLSSKSIAEIPLPLPPLNEQKRIVAKIEDLFTRLDAGIEGLKKVKAELKRYRQAVLKAAFEGKLTAEWRKKNKDKLEPASKLLERIAKGKVQKTKGKKHEKYAPIDTSKLPELPKEWCYSGIDIFLSTERVGMKTGPFGTMLKKHEHRTEGVPVLGIENIGKMRFLSGNKIFITKEKAEQLSAYNVTPGDIIISRSGTVGEICVIPEHVNNALISTNLMRICLNKDVVLPYYFGLMFHGCSSVLNQISDLCKGSTRDFLNQTILGTIIFPVAPYCEQGEILSEIERCFSIADEVEQTIDKCQKEADRLRQSILKRAFEGKLVPQDPNDEPADKLLERIKTKDIANCPKRKYPKTHNKET